MKERSMMNKKLVYVLMFSSLTSSGFAKHETSHTKWKEIIPEITKELLPPESQQHVEKIFPRKDKVARKKSPPDKALVESNKKKNKNGIEEYYGETKLQGKLLSPVHVDGSAFIKSAQSKEKIEVEGPTTIEQSQLNNVIIEGTLKAKKSTIQILKTIGATELKDCKIQSKTTINGSLKAENSHFHGPLHIAGNLVSLQSSDCHDVRLLPSSQRQKVILENTQVKGDLIFDDEPGDVILKRNSHIQGKIINGSVRTEK